MTPARGLHNVSLPYVPDTGMTLKPPRVTGTHRPLLVSSGRHQIAALTSIGGDFISAAIIAARIGADRNNITKVMSRLRARGLIQTHRQGREAAYRLTPLGEAEAAYWRARQ